jgi:hypothetical protein
MKANGRGTTYEVSPKALKRLLLLAIISVISPVDLDIVKRTWLSGHVTPGPLKITPVLLTTVVVVLRYVDV